MYVSAPFSQSWNVLALDGSNWQRIDLFDFQRDIEVKESKHPSTSFFSPTFCCVNLTSSLVRWVDCVVLFVWQGRVVENISKRCGGFLRKLSLRGCLGVGDSALRWVLPKTQPNASSSSFSDTVRDNSVWLPSHTRFFPVGLSHRTAETLSCLV